MKYIYYDKKIIDNQYFEEYNDFDLNSNITKYNELVYKQYDLKIL